MKRRVDAKGQAVSTETPQPAPTDWRPIETAPKNGMWLLLYGREFHRHWFGTGYYFKGVPGDGEGWIAHSFYTAPTNDSSGVFCPTHWMPLPAPPTVAEGPAAPASGKSRDVSPAIGSASSLIPLTPAQSAGFTRTAEGD